MEQTNSNTINTKNNTILVTGGNKGIGYSIVEALLAKSDKNHKIILTSRNEELGKEAIDKLLKKFPESKENLFYHQLDITDKQSAETLSNYVKDKFGMIDVLVNNAGIATKGTTFDYSTYESTFKTNVYGTIDLTELFLEKNLITKNGKVVIIGSTAGNLSRLSKEETKNLFRNNNLDINALKDICKKYGDAIQNNRVEDEGWVKNTYAVSKMAINTYAKILGQRKDVIDKGIQAYTCCPGWCRTDMAGPNATLSAEEGAVTPTFLIELEPKINNDYQGKFFYNCKPTSMDS